MRVWLLLLKWQYLRWRRELIFIIVIQVVLAVGIIYGLALLIPHIDARSAMYLATGAPTVSLLVMGFNIVPQEVSNGKLTGRFDYLSSLPIPRLATLSSDVFFWLVVQLPGTVLALVIASIRFDFDLNLSWMVVPAVGLVALTAACVGYGFALALRPEVANQITSFLAIGILLFSPINFPPERLPGLLRTVHTVLPIQYMADVIRYGLVGQGSAPLAVAFAVVGAWCAAGLAVSYRVATKRR
jgi:ABC-2 type transport system permease protein